MYEIRYRDNKWEVHTQGQGAYEGSMLGIIMFCVIKLGFTYEDIREGIEEMTWNDHDTAHFGIYRTFIYSYNQSEKKRVA
jgi:hypothetical protein